MDAAKLSRAACLALAFVLSASVASGANKFVWSGATGLNDGSAWEDAYTSVCRDWGAEAGFTPSTDFVYTRSSHSESFSAADCLITGTSADGATAVVRIISVAGADTGTTPGAPTFGAQITTTGVADTIDVMEYLYIWGFEFRPERQIRPATSTADHHITFENCQINIDGTDAATAVNIGPTGNSPQGRYVQFLDVDYDSNAAGSRWEVHQTNVLWEGGVINDDAADFLFGDIMDDGFIVEVRGLDASAATTMDFVEQDIDSEGFIHFEGSRIGTSASIVDGGNIPVGGFWAASFNVESGTTADPVLEMYIEDFYGATTLDTSRTRSGTRATNGSETYSFSLETTSGTRTQELYEAHRGPMIVDILLEGDGSTSKTITFYVAAGESKDNDEFWVDCSIQTDASDSSLGDIITSRAAPLATPAALTTDGSIWSGADVSFEMKITFSYTPDKDGRLRCWPFLAVDTERVSIDPIPDIS